MTVVWVIFLRTQSSTLEESDTRGTVEQRRGTFLVLCGAGIVDPKLAEFIRGACSSVDELTR